MSDLRSLQVNLLSERLAVALFKSKSNPIDEPKRRQIAEALLDQFDIRARWKEDRPVFGRPDDTLDSLVDLTLDPIDRVNLQEEIARVATLEGEGERSDTVDPSEPSESPESSVCSACLGRTRICDVCKLPEGNCWKRHEEVVVVCPECGGTGREPA